MPSCISSKATSLGLMLCHSMATIYSITLVGVWHKNSNGFYGGLQFRNLQTNIDAGRVDFPNSGHRFGHCSYSAHVGTLWRLLFFSIKNCLKND
jgi:hypothetical protein